MKVPPSNADRFSKKPDSNIRAILIYGPDGGLIDERLKSLSLSVVSDINDPFLVGELSGSKLKEDPALLADEAMAISMIGGRRVVRIHDCSDTQNKLLADFLANPVGDALILCVGGDLNPRSKLRKTFESAKNGAALACYADDNQSLDHLIRNKMGEANITIEPDAVSFLSSQLGSDRGVSVQEINKLILYIGDGDKANLDDVIACVGDIGVHSLDTIIYSAADGDAEGLDQALEKAWAESISPVPILRLMANHLLKLQSVHGKCEEGLNIKAAIKTLRPPVFFKMENRFINQMRLWPRPAISISLPLLLNAEADCKKTGMPDTLIAGRCLQQIAAIARKQRRR